MMESKALFSIAKITKVFSFKGEVGFQLLIRQYDDYLFNKQLSIGLNEKSVEILGRAVALPIGVKSIASDVPSRTNRALKLALNS